MDIEHALIADYAEIVQGKLYLMGGGWDTTHASQVPATVRLAVAVGVRLDWGDTDHQFPVVIRVEDDDGHEFVRIQGAVSASRPANAIPGAGQLAQVAANLQVTLPELGGYRVHVSVGGDEAAVARNLPFRIASA